MARRRRRLRVGYNVGYNPDADEAAQHSRRGGGRWLRFPASGMNPNWDYLDNYVRATKKAGVKPLISLAGPGSEMPRTRRQRRQFARTAAEVAKRYNTAGIEVWNEPNSKHFGGAIPAKKYAKLLRTTKRQIKRTGEKDRIFAGNTAPIKKGSKMGRAWAPWLKRVQKHGPKKGVEWAIHSYPGVGRRKRGAGQTIRQAKRARRITGQKPWVTEVGFSRARHGRRGQKKQYRRAYRGLSKHAKGMNVFALGQTAQASEANPDIAATWGGMSMGPGVPAYRYFRRQRRRR